MVNCGQVFKIHSDFYYINFENEIIECKLREVLKKQKIKICVGDFVEFSENIIQKLLPRKNYIPRPSVSNIDQMIIVSAVKEPELNFVQLNRYICFSRYYDLDIKLCFNKSDLSLDDKIIEKVFSIYEPLGYDIIFTSALENEGIEEFEALLKGKVSAFCGNSGVGKSSLINALNPDLHLKTKNVSSKTERGTHTTRHCEILKVTDDIRIVDTPGFSNLRFDFILPHNIDTLFEEFAPYKDCCKYADCLHVQEDGCQILEHIDEIAESRYESYLAFLEEAKEYKERIKYYGKKEETFTKTQHNREVAKISSRKRQVSRKTLKQQINNEELENDTNERLY